MPGVGAGEDHEVRVAPRLHRRANLRHHVAGRDHGLALEVAAALGRYLVFQEDAGRARLLEERHRALHVVQVAVAGVAVRDRGDGEAGRGAAHGIGHLAGGQEGIDMAQRPLQHRARRPLIEVAAQALG